MSTCSGMRDDDHNDSATPMLGCGLLYLLAFVLSIGGFWLVPRMMAWTP